MYPHRSNEGSGGGTRKRSINQFLMNNIIMIEIGREKNTSNFVNIILNRKHAYWITITFQEYCLVYVDGGLIITVARILVVSPYVNIVLHCENRVCACVRRLNANPMVSDPIKSLVHVNYLSNLSKRHSGISQYRIARTRYIIIFYVICVYDHYDIPKSYKVRSESLSRSAPPPQNVYVPSASSPSSCTGTTIHNNII